MIIICSSFVFLYIKKYNMTNEEMSFEEKVKTLKSYIQRVTDGEDMESVQEDFKENFSHVPAKEIAKAEQIRKLYFENKKKNYDTGR